MSDGETSIKLLTYNIFLRPPLIKTNESDHKMERMDYFLVNCLKDFDIVCFQELFTALTYRMEHITGQAKTLGYKHFAYIDRNLWKLKPIDSGLFILSKHEILETESIVFTKGLYSDSYATKGVLSVLVKIGDHKLLVLTTHLQAVYEDEKSQYTHVQRHQLEEARDFIAKLRKKHPGVDVVLMGDFNVDGLLPKDDVSGQLFYHEMYELLHNKDDKLKFMNLIPDHPITYGDYAEENGKKVPKEVILTHPVSHGAGVSLDYIFWMDVSGKWMPSESKVESFFVKDQIFTQLSDHYGLSTKLQLNKK